MLLKIILMLVAINQCNYEPLDHSFYYIDSDDSIDFNVILPARYH